MARDDWGTRSAYVVWIFQSPDRFINYADTYAIGGQTVVGVFAISMYSRVQRIVF
jgi:hypothetical protein